MVHLVSARSLYIFSSIFLAPVAGLCVDDRVRHDHALILHAQKIQQGMLKLNLPFACQALLNVGQVPVLDLEWAALVKNPTPVWL